MKNKQFTQLYKLLKAGKSHSGFTLIELLSGLMMSTIVIVGLSYGLVQLTRATRNESNKTTARSEAARTIEFISDEVRRAQSIEVDNSIGNLDTPAIADDYNLPTGAIPTNNAILALQIPGVTQRVIYSVAPPQTGSPWQGPLVIYRWGPNLNGDGAYNDPDDTSGWQNQALIDGVDDSVQNVTCNGANVTYQGFFACIVDDDNDGIVENEVTDVNGNGILENDDIDGSAITAQLFFTSDIDIANTDDDKEYTADTQVVARARVRDTNAAQAIATTPISFKSLGAEYSLGTIGTSCNGKTTWTMRNDFFNDPQGSSPTYTPTTWIHEDDRQGQQIEIDTANPLTISSIPFLPNADSSCGATILSRGNQTGVEGTPSVHEEVPGTGGDDDAWNPKDIDLDGIPDFETSDFTIKFDDPKTFNGGETDNPVPEIDGDEVDHVRIFRKGSVIEYIKDGTEITLGGYDDDPDTDDGEYSLGEYLAFKGYAVEIGSTGKYRLVDDSDNLDTNPFYDSIETPNAHKTLIKLEDKERIVAIEIGQVEIGAKFDDGTYNPGFDLQDNLVKIAVDVFDPNYSSTPSH